MSQSYYTHLTHDERVILADWWQDGHTIRAIAKHIGRSASTISRELGRNGRPATAKTTRVNKPRADGRHVRGTAAAEIIKQRKRRYEKRRKLFEQQKRRRYTVASAEQLARSRIKVQIPKLERSENAELLSFVLTALDSRWSPEQISGRIKHEGLLPYISHQSIYDFIQCHPELALKSCLRRKGKKYRKQKISAYNHTNNRRSIDERPAEVDELKRIGDLEGDTIVGMDKTDRLLTHNDRLSGKVSISRVIGFNAKKISKQTISDTKRVFPGKIYSATYDNGIEFAWWHMTEKKLKTKIYFAHAYHSWERGRNENTNGLIRDFLPKGTDFKSITDDDILMIESLLNNRPRKRLGWLTPSERYALHTQRANVALGG